MQIDPRTEVVDQAVQRLCSVRLAALTRAAEGRCLWREFRCRLAAWHAPEEAATALSLSFIRISLASTGDTRTTSITKTRGRGGAHHVRAPRSRSQQRSATKMRVSLDILDIVG